MRPFFISLFIMLCVFHDQSNQQVRHVTVRINLPYELKNLHSFFYFQLQIKHHE